MHDAKTVAFAQHFLEIGGPLTVQDRMALLLSALSPVLAQMPSPAMSVVLPQLYEDPK
jgi:hypothetical protein